ncbi:MAG: type 2 isopentenyl-diphosphate Delta-isomerase [Anaerolineaceae bacterium]|nr:type 2 isopentenyl-diphosphate Delta-isomerase [Anaerolineae bacterium]MCB9459858.1 type 2 isopentenyl-diphosphate Delta-isomerase [Anaerolineaceae bacterium]
MAEVTQDVTTETRKMDHIRINLEENVDFPRLTTGLEQYRFLHRALPEIDLADVDTSVTLFNKTLSVPILISSMTGGAEMAQRINKNLAIAAQKHGIAMGVGSQRAAIEDDALASTFEIRQHAPDILLFANIGAVQLNYGYGTEECQRAVDMIGADALILHFNVLQEAVQPEGDTNFAGLLKKVENVAKSVSVPIIAKEVGWGFSEADVRSLANAGVQAIDVAGAGGTSWSEVEFYRAQTQFHANVARSFADWGIPTADAILYAKAGAPNLPVIASGGIRNGIDIAKSIALGATVGGMAGPFLKAADISSEAVDHLVQELAAQIRISMLCTGSATIADLQQAELIKSS